MSGPGTNEVSVNGLGLGGVRVTFSPFTAEPDFLHDIAVAALAGQVAVLQTLWAAQWQAACTVGLAMLQAQCAVLDAAARRG